MQRMRVGIFAAFLTFAFLLPTGCSSSGVSGPSGDHETGSFASIVATPQSGKAPLKVSFRAVDLAHAMFGAVTKYSWDFGDGTRAEGLTVEHTYTQMGKYAVILTILYQDGSQQVSRKTIEVK